MGLKKTLLILTVVALLAIVAAGMAKFSIVDNVIPSPFGAVTDGGSLGASITDIGAKSGRRVLFVNFDDGTSSEPLTKEALHVVLTPDAERISHGSLLSVAFTEGKKIYGYTYTSRDAQTERDADAAKRLGVPLTFPELFPGEFFASESMMDDPEVSVFASDNTVVFHPLADVTLERNARYVVLVKDTGALLTVEGLPEPLPRKTFVSAHAMPWTGKTIQVQDDLVAFQADGTYISMNGGRDGERIAAYPYDYFGDPYIDPIIARYGTSYIVTGNVAMCLVGSTRHRCQPGETPTSVRAGSVSQMWGEGWTGFTPPPSVEDAMYSIGDFRGTRWRIHSGIQQWRGTPAQEDLWGRQPAWEAVDGIIFDRPLASVAVMGTSLVAISVDGKRLYEQDENLVWHTYEVEGIVGDVRALLSERDSLLVVAGIEGEGDRAYILPDTHAPFVPPVPPEQVCGNGVYDVTWNVSEVREAFGASWSSMAYGNGFFMAATSSAYNYMLISLDGLTWGLFGGPSLTGITYGNGTFVGVAPYKVMSATDSTWIARQIAANNPWNSVTYGNGIFVAVASSGLQPVMTSPDGITWTARSAIQKVTSTDVHKWSAVTYGNGLFVAVSPIGINRVMTSPDGITWTARQAASQKGWNKIMYGDGIFVATDGGTMMTSADGAMWTEQTVAQATGMTYDNGLFVAVTPSMKKTSPNGVTWTDRKPNTILNIAYGNGLFVAVTQFSILTSPDGITWTATMTADQNNIWSSITYGNGLFALAGGSGNITRVMTSRDEHEQCDDGNDIDTDGCRNDCTLQL